MMERENNCKETFDMGTLKASLPQKGLSRFYPGKSRSFTCMEDVCCLEDLKKQERPRKKIKKQHSERHQLPLPPPPPPLQ